MYVGRMSQLDSQGWVITTFINNENKEAIMRDY